ncbi:MAG: metallophosphoesterase [Deltaproteobacteria bacterium]|nr:metallophosphoesterase [Deltaproteobacteria bacterium]
MARVIPMILFALVFLTVVGSIHYYIWVRIVKDTALSTPWRQIATGVVVALGVSIPLTMFLSRGYPFEAVRNFTWLPYVWLGVMMLLFFFFLTVDMIRLVAFLGAKAAGAQPLGADPTRRLFLGRIVAGSAVAVVGGLSSVAVYNAAKKATIERVDVSLTRLPPALNGLRIAQISDLHVGIAEGKEWLAKIVARVNELKPDVVAITGDLIDGMVPQLGSHIAPLADLKAKHGIYFVTGNHEYYFGVDQWIHELQKLDVKVLRNEWVELGEGEDLLYLAGVDDPEGGRMAPGHGQDLKAALKGMDPKKEVVLLAHQPTVIDEAAANDVGLVLAGHTHGGQIWPFTYLVKMAMPYNKGLHRHKGRTQIYVNQGTGYWGPPMRLGTKSEITQITLTRG